MKDLLLHDFIEIFKGSHTHYGQHIYASSDDGLKEKGRSWTVKGACTVEHYRSHLEGEIGLGIVPINEENKCKFSVIDIDIYDIESYAERLKSCLNAIDVHKIPMVPFRSKSGGLHLYTFYKEWISAEMARQFSYELASILGLVNLAKEKTGRMIETFPKQGHLKKGSSGNWINLPYGNSANTRAIVGDKNLSFEEAIAHIKGKQISHDDVKSFIDNMPFHDAPPCLQTIYLLNNLGDGDGRNNFVFNMGVYFKKKFPNSFELKIDNLNDYLNSPLEHEELTSIVKSISSKDYDYRLSDTPMCHFRDEVKCAQREYGIGKKDGHFSILEYGQLFEIGMLEPYYEWELKKRGDAVFKRIRIDSASDLKEQGNFLTLCIKQLRYLPNKLKQTAWTKIVNRALEDIKIVEVKPENDTSTPMVFRAFFAEFIRTHLRADEFDQIIEGLVFFDTTNNDYYFRTTDLLKYLQDKSFRLLRVGTVHGMLKDIGCISKVRKLKSTKKAIRVHTLSKKSFDTFSFDNDDKPTPEVPFEDKEEERVLKLVAQSNGKVYE